MVSPCYLMPVSSAEREYRTFRAVSRNARVGSVLAVKGAGAFARLTETCIEESLMHLLASRSTALRAPVAAVTGVLTMVGLLSFQTAQAPVASASTTTTYSWTTAGSTTWSAPSAGEISVTVKGGQGEGLPAYLEGNSGSSGGAGSSVTVTRTVTASETFTLRADGAAAMSCGSVWYSGLAATIYKAADLSDAVVAGGGGAGGCNRSAVLSSSTPGDGGAAGIPTGQGTFAGNAGGNADNGNPSYVTTGGGGGQTGVGGTAGSGYIYSGTPSPCCDATPGFVYSIYPVAGGGSGGADGAGKGGAGGGGRTSGGGGGSTGFSAAAGGGGGSSYVGASWTFASAASNSSTGAEIVIVFTAADDADLSNLQISQGALSPAFGAATTEYTASVASSVTSLTVTPTTASSGATVTVDGATVASGSASGAIAVGTGSTTITVVVTSADTTTTKTYTITVTPGAVEEEEIELPPSWYQAYQRASADEECKSGWDPSWAEWANNASGGWTCERTIMWDVRRDGYVEESGFRSVLRKS